MRLDPRSFISHLEGWWFDRTRHVATSEVAFLERLSLLGAAEKGLMYLPARPASVRLALRDLPLTEHQNYTFVDLGSGKGRMLFLAAEHAFRRIEGVEFARELHAQAQDNISRYRHPGRKCREIESVHMDALNYAFPNDNLVIALFNPFGPEVMKTVLRHVRESVLETPRDVILMMLFPELAAAVDPQEWRTVKSTRRYQIYRLVRP